MTTEHQPSGEHGDRLEMPSPTLWPMVMAAGVTLMGAGVLTSYVFTLVGFIILIISLAYWMSLLLPGRGEFHEEMVPPGERARTVRVHVGEVAHLQPGMAGHRMRYPEKIHPYSAGAKGGLIGALVMPIPAFLYGLISGKGIIYPVNLLVGMVVPLDTVNGKMTPAVIAEMQEFHFLWFFAAIIIHVVLSVSLGLMYGVLLPMLGNRPLLWGGLVAPLLWTGASYGFMGVLNPAMAGEVYWPAFIASQFVFGITVGIVVVRTEKVFAEDATALFGGRRSRQTMVSPPESNP